MVMKNYARFVSGLALLVAVLVSNYAYAYCAGGVVSGTTTVYKCDGSGCSSTADPNYQRYRWYLSDCAYICCPDGSVEIGWLTCTESSWQPHRDCDICGQNCCHSSEYSVYAYVQCDPL